MSPKNKPDKPLAAYTRVSSQGDRADEELHSHDLQRARIEAGATAFGYEVSPDRFEDTNASGGKMDRPAFNRVMEGIRRGEYGGVVVAKLSRFGRTVSGALATIKEIEEHKAAFVSLDPPIDTSSATGRFVLTVFLALYAMEREATAEGQMSMLDMKIEAGIHQSTVAPAGYDYSIAGHKLDRKTGKTLPVRGKLVPNEHAPAVREAFELRGRGGTWAQLVALLTERGVPSRSGRWSYTGARSLIENEAYRGVALSGERRKEGAHEEIVDRVLFAAANARTGTRAVTWNGQDGPLLGGLIKCRSCGGAMSKDWTSRKNSGKRYMSYKCKSNPSCGPGSRASISALQVEPFVVDAALAALGGDVAYTGREPVDDPVAEEWAAALDTIAAEETELKQLLDDGNISATAYAVSATELERRREELEASRPTAALGEEFVVFVSETGVRDALERMPTPVRRKALGFLVERVTVRAGRGSVEDRVTVELADFDPAAHGLVPATYTPNPDAEGDRFSLEAA